MDRQSSSRRRRRPAQRTTSQRLTLGGTTGIILLLIVFFVQYGLGVDVLNTEQKEAPPATAANVAEPVVAPSTALVAIPGGYDGGWFQLYFTAPVPGASESTFHDSPIEAALVAAIDRAEQSVDMAIYELESQPVTDALIRAKERGVQVRVVTDGEYGLEDPDTTFDQLELAGIPVVSDGARRGYMHNKFVVIDGLYVWTGSTNFKPSCLYRNNNNSMLIRSSRLAQNYTAEFEELFAGQFGAGSPKTVANPVITVEGTRIETYFESEGDVGARLAELIKGAHSVRFMAFSFTESLRWRENGTERSVMLLLRDRALAGELDVKGIIEASSRSGIKPLLCAGLNIRQDGNPDVMHHKVFIFDEAIVAMGSFNFSSRAANENDENMLIIHNPDIARAYLEEFDRLWAAAGPIPAAVTADCG